MTPWQSRAELQMELREMCVRWNMVGVGGFGVVYIHDTVCFAVPFLGLLMSEM
jgi:hypothetical protein